MRFFTKILFCLLGLFVLSAPPAYSQTINTLVGICSAGGYYGDGGPASLHRPLEPG